MFASCRVATAMTTLARCSPQPSTQPGRPAGRWAAPALATLAWLAGCASGPPAGPAGGGAHLPVARPSPSIAAPNRDFDRDGPGLHVPPDLALVPDAQPRLETVLAGGPNKPYAVLGQPYTPLAGDPVLIERGLASWYGSKFHGRSTANGETYNMYAMTAAHKTMPLPSYARVRNPANGREVVVRVNDRGPFHAHRVIDLSYTAALKLGVLGGVAPVEIERITYEAIRSGAWGAPADNSTVLLVQAAARTDLLAQAAPALDPSADPIAEIARRYTTAPTVTGLDAPAAGSGPRAPPSVAWLPTSAPTPTSNQPPSSLQPAPPSPAAPPLPPETNAPAQAAAKAAPGFWLQLGAFGQRDGAVGFQQRVSREVGWLAPLMTIFNERNLHRLQAGPYASRADAIHAANRLRDALRFLPPVVERR